VQAGKDPLLVTRDPEADPFAELVVIGKEVPAGTDLTTLYRREKSAV
jgi:hypothetical protein